MSSSKPPVSLSEEDARKARARLRMSEIIEALPKEGFLVSIPCNSLEPTKRGESCPPRTLFLWMWCWSETDSSHVHLVEFQSLFWWIRPGPALLDSFASV